MSKFPFTIINYLSGLKKTTFVKVPPISSPRKTPKSNTLFLKLKIDIHKYKIDTSLI